VRVWTRLKFAVAAALVTAATALPALADPTIWRVTGPHATVFIVGSTPTAPADGKWKTTALQQAAASAQEIWFVTPFGLPGPITALRMLTVMQTKGYLPEGQKLSAMLSPDARARMARLAARYGLNVDKLDRMTPWNADGMGPCRACRWSASSWRRRPRAANARSTISATI
jgi:uncharacterized protein YbaP (TraB family)